MTCVPIGNLMIETQVALTQQRSIPEYEALLASNIESTAVEPNAQTNAVPRARR